MSDAIAIADEVVELLNEAPLSVELNAARKIVPLFELQDLADLKVTVRPAALDVQLNTRAASLYEYDIEIGLQKHLDDIEADIDEMVSLVMEIVKFLRGKSLSTNKAVWVKTGIDPLYMTEHLQGGSVFTSVITVTYRTIE